MLYEFFSFFCSEEDKSMRIWETGMAPWQIERQRQREGVFRLFFFFLAVGAN